MPAGPKIMLTTRAGIVGKPIPKPNFTATNKIKPRIEFTIIFFKKSRSSIVTTIKTMPTISQTGLPKILLAAFVALPAILPLIDSVVPRMLLKSNAIKTLAY